MELTSAAPGAKIIPEDVLIDLIAHNPYIPHMPTGRQLAFLELSCLDALFGGAAGGGKLLYNGTMIPTPEGFRPLRELRPGDLILGRDGKSHVILAESELVTAPAYRLTFDDGAQLDAHDDHRWLTFDAKELGQLTRLDPEFRARRRANRASRSAIGAGQRWKHTQEHREHLSQATTARNRANAKPRTAAPEGSVRTTAEIVATLTTRRGRINHAIPVAEPIELPEKQLPLDPYVLGVWLGDGSSGNGDITTADAEITEAIVAAGFPVRRVSRKPNNKAATYAHEGLRVILKGMGLLDNKSVPHDYLWASKDQRLALLQGLLDTDGGVEQGAASFTNTRKGLTEAVAHLARSLGHKATVREGVARLNGRNMGPKWVVKFAAKTQVFRLGAKAAKLKIASRRTTRFRYIVAAERIAAIEMKCLRVSAPDHLFLAGEHLIPTHNSDALLMAGLMFAQVPGYSAMILRRNLTDLKLPGGLIDRSLDWLKGKAHYNAQEHRWRFKEGSTLQFGFADKEGDELRYHSSEFQFIGIDEGVQFTERQVKFFFERLRKKVEIPVPLRVRLGTTPGGVGHEFLKKRYIEPGTPGKVFIPATLRDNPHVDQEQYVESLGEVDPLRRKQMLDGDWDAVEGGRFKREWFGSWKVERGTADTMILRDYKGAEVERFQYGRCGRFQTCDPAASTSAAADYFALSTWLVTPKANVVWWGCRRDKYDIEDQVRVCQSLYRRYESQFVGIEKVLNQTALFQMLQKRPMVVRALSPKGRDKLARAAGFITLASSGRVFLPEPPCPDFPLDEVLDELIRFTGDDKKDAHDDVVDTGSYMTDLLPMVRPGAGGGTGTGPIRHESRSQPWSGLR